MLVLLNGRTRGIPIAAKHAAIALLGFQHFTTIWTFPEKLAGIRGHGFGCFIFTAGTGNG
jgi:hypothetical protein